MLSLKKIQFNGELKKKIEGNKKNIHEHSLNFHFSYISFFPITQKVCASLY